ncbi:MAG: hypothetical protein NVS9B14_16740 [Candidatus Acidiferrum sp.]
MIAPKVTGLATPLCYASSERIECMKRTCAKGLWRWTAIVLLLWGGAWPCAGQTTEGEPTVVGVRIIREDGTVIKDSPAGLPVGTGKALNRGQVAATNTNGYKSSNSVT